MHSQDKSDARDRNRLRRGQRRCEDDDRRAGDARTAFRRGQQDREQPQLLTDRQVDPHGLREKQRENCAALGYPLPPT